MVMADYVAASGDTAFLKQHAAEVARAWQFESTHDADGDGIYDNAQGTGWVESWIPAMPKQEGVPGRARCAGEPGVCQAGGGAW